MNAVVAQTLEPPGAAPAVHAADASDLSPRPDALSGVARAQALLGNTSVAGAVMSGRSGGAGRSGDTALRWTLRAASIQAKLAVSRPGDMYEQEADRVAAMVTRMSEPTAPSEKTTPTLQRKPLLSRLMSFVSGAVSRKPEVMAAGGLPGENHREVSGDIESRIGSTRGGGRPLSPSLRAFFEPRFGADFGNVRVHTGDDAVQMNRQVGARAFSHGSDIYFGDGNSPSDLELTAHELTHVLQQTGDGADVMRSAPAIQRTPVTTNGGTFDTTTYVANSAPTGAVGEGLGANIVLEFTANDLVESTKIGLIQSVKAMKSSVAGGPRTTVATGVGDPEEGQLIMGPGQADPGREIDRAVHPGGRAQPNTSPIYGVHNTPASVATALGHGRPTTSTSQWGSHTRDPVTGAFRPAVPARIDDAPGRLIEFVGQTFEHTFESAAIAIEGPIAPNTYLGSVSWGWRSDAAGQVTVDPLALVQAGAPSAEFMGAAQRWNAATFHDTGTGAAATPVAIPLTTRNSGATAVGGLSTTALVTRIEQLTPQIAGLAAGTDRTNMEFEKRALEAELARRNVRVSVHVISTTDVTGADEVYVRVTGPNGAVYTSPPHDINDTQSHDFMVPLATLLPLNGPIRIEVLDEDWPDSDDRVADINFRPPWASARDQALGAGAHYEVDYSFER